MTRSLTIASDNLAEYSPFPLPRQRATVRKAAEAVNDRHYADADTYWLRRIAVKCAEMVEAVISEEAVECELRAFTDSVFASLQNRCG